MKNTISVGAVYDNNFARFRTEAAMTEHLVLIKLSVIPIQHRSLIFWPHPSALMSPPWPNGKYNPGFNGTSAACHICGGCSSADSKFIIKKRPDVS